jgi:hypothetical protein
MPQEQKESWVDRIDAIQELRGNVCQGCRGRKETMKSFCLDCYRRLPAATQSALYKRVENGYAAQYRAAKEYLKTEKAGRK